MKKRFFVLQVDNGDYAMVAYQHSGGHKSKAAAQKFVTWAKAADKFDNESNSYYWVQINIIHNTKN